MAYVDHGAGPPLLMVHGNPTWSFYWRSLIEPLSHHWRAIAVDHVGCGRSAKPQHYSYTLEQHIANLCCLVDRLDLRDVTLVAHDWGGPIGLGMATRMADRVRRLVLLNTAVCPPPYIPWRIRAARLPLIGELAVRGLNAFVRGAARMATAQRGGLVPTVREGLAAPYDSWSNRIAVHRFVRDIPTSPRHPTWGVLEEIEQGLSRLADRPVLIVWGMHDWCFRSSLIERLRGHWPHAHVHRIAEAGHFVLEDAPDEVASVIGDFLERTSGAHRAT